MSTERDILIDGDPVRPITDIGSVPYLQQITTVSFYYLFFSVSLKLLNVSVLAQ